MSTGSPATSRAAARTATRPTFDGSVAAVATHGLFGSVITAMSAVEMSAPYTFTRSCRPSSLTASTAPLANSSYGAKIAFTFGFAWRAAFAWSATADAVELFTTPICATCLMPGLSFLNCSQTSLRRSSGAKPATYT